MAETGGGPTVWRIVRATTARLIRADGQGSGMPTRNTVGTTALERLRRRYETTEKKCPDCGFVDESGNWTSRTDGRRVVYHYVCPSCGAARNHTFQLGG